MEAGKERESERAREGRGERGNCGSRDGGTPCQRRREEMKNFQLDRCNSARALGFFSRIERFNYKRIGLGKSRWEQSLPTHQAAPALAWDWKDERLCGTAGGYLSLISDKPGQVTKQKRGQMIGSF